MLFFALFISSEAEKLLRHLRLEYMIKIQSKEEEKIFGIDNEN